jgi:hypothetical protein
MATYVKGRRVPAARIDDQPSAEALQIIRKLRWLGMEEEADEAQSGSRYMAAITLPPETD